MVSTRVGHNLLLKLWVRRCQANFLLKLVELKHLYHHDLERVIIIRVSRYIAWIPIHSVLVVYRIQIRKLHLSIRNSQVEHSTDTIKVSGEHFPNKASHISAIFDTRDNRDVAFITSIFSVVIHQLYQLFYYRRTVRSLSLETLLNLYQEIENQVS